MNSLRQLLQIVTLVLLCGLVGVPQSSVRSTKRFNKDGVSFSYPARWRLLDSSSQEAQKFLLESGSSEASIMLLVYRDRVPAENRDQARETALSYVASTLKQYEGFGAKPKTSAARLKIGSARAEGMIIRGKLDEPRTDEIYWALINERVVVLMFGGSNKDSRRARPAWHTVRSSIQIAGTNRRRTSR